MSGEVCEKRIASALSHPDPARRRQAAESLAARGEPAVRPLIGALWDPHPAVQDAALGSLIAIGGEATARAVAPLLRRDAVRRNAAAVILRGIGKDAVPVLLPLVEDEDRCVRKLAIDAIADIGFCPEPERIARRIVSDADPNVRAAAARAVGLLRDRGAVPNLVGALSDCEWVQFAALEALSGLADPSAAGAVAALLADGSPAVRCAAAEALGSIGGKDAAEALRSYVGGASGEARKAAVRGLVRCSAVLPREEVLETLYELLRNGDPEDMLLGARGLAALDEQRALREVLDAAGSLDSSRPGDEETRAAIIAILSRWGCEEALIALLDGAGGLRFRGKVVAVEALGAMRSKAALPVLLALAETDLRDVREACLRAIGAIKAQEGAA